MAPMDRAAAGDTGAANPDQDIFRKNWRFPHDWRQSASMKSL